MKLKTSNCDQGKNSNYYETQIVMKLINSNCDKTKKNLRCDKTQKLKL